MQTIDEPTSSAPEADDALPHDSMNHEDIATLAYQFWEEGGRNHGNHEEDWQRAEKQILKMRDGDSTVGSHVA
jgi:hypothetical protein